MIFQKFSKKGKKKSIFFINIAIFICFILLFEMNIHGLHHV